MWKDLIFEMPLKVLLQNLPRLHHIGVLKNDNMWIKCVLEQIMDQNLIDSSRLQTFR